MVFVQVPGAPVLYSVWETRLRDFAAFAEATGHDPNNGYTLEAGGWKQVGGNWRNPRFPAAQTGDHPVVCVSREDAEEFCRWLTEKERNEGLLSQHQGYRLPTEAEWQSALGVNKYPWGDEWPPPEGAGNYPGEEAEVGAWPSSWESIKKWGYRDGHARTAPVGSYRTNWCGLYDLGGNVWEWCAGLGEQECVLRGHSWSSVSGVTPFGRMLARPDHRDVTCGFRCVVAPTTQ